jgi:copper(I)-binding protein
MGGSDLFHLIGAAALLMTVAASHADAAELKVSDAWIRALPRSVPSGGYFTLRNSGSRVVVLTGAESPACGMLMLHKSENHGGMGMMMDMDTVEVPAGGTVRFAPGGQHLMCMQAGPAIRPGSTVPVTLHFKNGGTLVANFQVRDAAGK